MNRRQGKKLDKQLIQAIRELNDDVAKSEGFPMLTDERLLMTVKKVKRIKGGASRTLKDYKLYIKH